MKFNHQFGNWYESYLSISKLDRSFHRQRQAGRKRLKQFLSLNRLSRTDFTRVKKNGFIRKDRKLDLFLNPPQYSKLYPSRVRLFNFDRVNPLRSRFRNTVNRQALLKSKKILRKNNNSVIRRKSILKLYRSFTQLNANPSGYRLLKFIPSGINLRRLRFTRHLPRIRIKFSKLIAQEKTSSLHSFFSHSEAFSPRSDLTSRTHMSRWLSFSLFKLLKKKRLNRHRSRLLRRKRNLISKKKGLRKLKKKLKGLKKKKNYRVYKKTKDRYRWLSALAAKKRSSFKIGRNRRRSFRHLLSRAFAFRRWYKKKTRIYRKYTKKYFKRRHKVVLRLHSIIKVFIPRILKNYRQSYKTLNRVYNANLSRPGDKLKFSWRRLRINLVRRWHYLIFNKPWKFEPGMLRFVGLRRRYRRIRSLGRQLSIIKSLTLKNKFGPTSLVLRRRRWSRRRRRKINPRNGISTNIRRGRYPNCFLISLSSRRRRSINRLRNFALEKSQVFKKISHDWSKRLNRLTRRRFKPDNGALVTLRRSKYMKKRNRLFLTRKRMDQDFILSQRKRDLLKVVSFFDHLNDTIDKLFNSLAGTPLKLKFNFKRKVLFLFKRRKNLAKLLLQLSSRVGFRIKKRGASKIRVPRLISRRKGLSSARRILKTAIKSRAERYLDKRIIAEISHPRLSFRLRDRELVKALAGYSFL